MSVNLGLVNRPVRIYCAAAWPTHEVVSDFITSLVQQGVTAGRFQFTSTWHQLAEQEGYDDVGDESPEDKSERLFKSAVKDVKEVREAEGLLLWDDPNKDSSGGCHTELGIAIERGYPVALVGGRSNIFHYLDNVHVFHHPAIALIWLEDRIQYARRSEPQETKG